VYRLSFAEPWDWNEHDLRIAIDALPAPVEWPIYGRVVACSWHDSFVGRTAEVRRRLGGDETPLDRFPVVSVAVESADTDSGWRGLGFGKLALVR
jgi:hypothetical protein